MRYLSILFVAITAIGCGGAQRFATEAQLRKWHYRPGGQVGDVAVKATRERLAWVRPASPIPIHTTQQPDRAVRSVAASLVDETYYEPITPLANEQPRGRDSNGAKLFFDQPAIHDPQQPQVVPPERTAWNWLAVASPIILIIALVAAIPAQSTELLLIGCLAALAAAIIGARQCREKGQKGQGFAMAVMGLAAAGALIALIALLARL